MGMCISKMILYLSRINYSGPSKAKNQQFLSNKIESTNCTETLSHFSLFCNCLSICVFLLFKTLKVRRLCSSSKGFLKLAAIPGVLPVCVFAGLTTVWRCSYIFHIWTLLLYVLISHEYQDALSALMCSYIGHKHMRHFYYFCDWSYVFSFYCWFLLYKNIPHTCKYFPDGSYPNGYSFLLLMSYCLLFPQ